MKHKLLTLTLIIFLLAVFPAFALAGSAILHWQPDSAPDLAGYRIYYGTASRSYGPYIPVGKDVTSYTLNGLVEGNTYYFALTAVDTSGNESGFSAEVSKTILSPDSQPPSISIDSPTAQGTYETRNSSITISGVSSDNVSVAQVTWVNSKGGSGVASGSTSWQIANIALVEGDNMITVTAHDASGNSANDTIIVTYTPGAPPGAVNLAFGKRVTQSSTYLGSGANRAVDGKTDGNWADGSVTHTARNRQAWWQVDLGAVDQITSINIWNRSDAVPERLSDFYVFVSDTAFESTNVTDVLSQPGVTGYHVSGTCGRPTKVDVNRSGRFVRVQLVGDNYLSLAEVEVFGKP